MRLKMFTGKGLDLKRSVYAEIAEEYKNRIPIMTYFKRGGKNPNEESLEHIQFRGLPRLKKVAIKIALRNTGRFISPSDIHRAAHYLGMSIIGHLFLDDNDGPIDEAADDEFYKIIMKDLESRRLVDMLRIALVAATDNFRLERLGIICERTRRRKVSGLKDSLPSELQKPFDNLLTKIRKMGNIPEEFQSWEPNVDRVLDDETDE